MKAELSVLKESGSRNPDFENTISMPLATAQLCFSRKLNKFGKVHSIPLFITSSHSRGIFSTVHNISCDSDHTNLRPVIL